MRICRVLAPMFVCLLLSCTGLTAQEEIVRQDKSRFEQLHNGKQVSLYTLENANGLLTEITNFGGKVVSLWIPDRQGKFEDVVLGCESLDDYLVAKEKYLGALVGRYGNRIAKGQFQIEGQTYTLATNNNENHLHGGNKGYDAVVWEANQIDKQTLELRYTSGDMEEGYPGKLEIIVVYQLTDANELKITYEASTDKSTHVNLTHHSFFNLKGAGNGSINDHLLQVNAAFYTPVDEGLIPTGIITSVENTPFDFQEATSIGSRIEEDHEQLKRGHGYDHNFVLNQSLQGLNFAAKVIEPVSGRVMEVYTNEPGLQFYGGNFLNGSTKGKNGKTYDYRTAFCLETQHFPDSPNQPQFPTTLLEPGETYYSTCIYKFGIVK
ncbi:MAG: aldose epimerase family protein [Bacteroidota bacterium]